MNYKIVIDPGHGEYLLTRQVITEKTGNCF